MMFVLPGASTEAHLLTNDRHRREPNAVLETVTYFAITQRTQTARAYAALKRRQALP